jgi:hypothetical protein
VGTIGTDGEVVLNSGWLVGTIGTDGEAVLNSGWLIGTIGMGVCAFVFGWCVENGDDEEVSAREAGERGIAI